VSIILLIADQHKGTMKSTVKLSWREKIGFSIGEYSASVVWGALMFFIPSFYTDTFGLTAGSVALMFLVVRLFDSLNDPIMGLIADQTTSRWGKFRPYLLWFAVPYGCMALLLFNVPDFDYTGKLIYAYLTYGVMMIIYTAIMIPYNAMVGVLTPNTEERTVLSSLKFVFAYAASMSVQGFVIPMVEYFGNGDDILGYRVTMGIFGGICIVFFLIAFATSKERVAPPADQKPAIKVDLQLLLRNRAWILLMLVSLGILIYVAIRSAIILYYFEYVIGDKSGAGQFMVVGTIFVLIGVLPTKVLSRLIGKRKLFMVCMMLITLSSAGFYWAGENMFLLYVFQILFSLASGPTMPLLWAMLADVADYGEWKDGRRSTALVYSAATLAQKAGFSIGGAIIMWLMAWAGYTAGEAQNEAALLTIRLGLSMIPAAIAGATVIVLQNYNLDENMLRRVSLELQARRL